MGFPRYSASQSEITSKIGGNKLEALHVYFAHFNNGRGIASVESVLISVCCSVF